MSYADSVSTNKRDLGAVWKKIKKMKGQVVDPEYDLRQGNSVYSSDQAKADAFAEAFDEASDCYSLPADMRQRRREMEVNYSDPEPDDSRTVNSPLTLAQFKRALSAIKKVKVYTGVDTVSYHMLREMPESFPNTVLGFFQRCWEGGAFPAGWKHAVVVPIHKHGKPRKGASPLGKVFERVVKHRLEYYCESKKVFPACLAGFRRGRGVTDHLVKLGKHIGKALSKRKVLLSCFSTFLELTTRSGIPSCCRNSTKWAFLVRCTTTLRHFYQGGRCRSGGKGPCQNGDIGVPQGSVIAPLLFTVMVHVLGRWS